MSRDIFADFGGSPPRRTHFGFALSRAQNESSSNLVPRDPEMQRFVDAMNAERDTERARKEVEMNTPENRQKAAEAKVAERERKRINFHFGRALPMDMEEGWKHLREELMDEEIRVYTINNQQRRFWGIKPAGMGMYDFWEQNDPEVGRYEDQIAVTWSNPLIPPPVTTFDENNPVIWAGQGLNPDLKPPEPPPAKAPSPTKAAAKSRRRPKTPEINPSHRFRRSTRLSPKIDKNTRKSLIDRDPAPLKRSRGRPPAKAKLASKNDTSSLSKHPRGRPAVKAQPAASREDALPLKRPRGRPPKGKAIEGPSKQKKTPTVKGSRVTKSSQTKPRPLVPSTHKMRTRREGLAELLQLP